jgi:hypothetical protein
VFDLHELTKNYETKGKETRPYIDYMVSVINLYAHMCIGANQTAIEKIITKTGINEPFILKATEQDSDTYEIHEKLRQAFMRLTQYLFIENNPVGMSISMKNRCYVWETLSGPKQITGDDEYNEMMET